MKTSTPSRNPNSALRVCAAVCLLQSAVGLHAATRDKADNADDFNLTSSWVGGLVPGSADVARFNSVVTGPITVALGTDTTWNQLNFLNPGGNVTISGGTTLTLSNNTPILFGTGTTDLTLDCNLVCAGSSFLTLQSAPTGRTVTCNGTVAGRDVGVTLGNTTGTLRLGNANSTRIGSVVSVTGTGVKLGIGASSTGNPITSGPLGTNLFTWNSALTTTELFTYNGDQTLGNPVRIQASPLNFNSADDLTFANVADFNNGNRIFNVASNGVLRFTGTISNATGLTKTGSGLLELGGTNISVWNNGLSILGGTVRLLTNNVIPDGSGKGLVRMTNVAHVLDLNGFSDTVNGFTSSAGFGDGVGTVDNLAPGTTSVLTVGANDTTFSFAGVLQNTGLGSKLALVKTGTGTMTLTNANTFGGGLTNLSGGAINFNVPGAAGTGQVVVATPDATAAIVFGAGSGTLTWTNDIIVEAGAQPALYASAGGTLDVAGIISGPGAVRRTDGGTGGLILSGGNTFTGGFTLQNRVVTLSHPRAVGRGTFNIGSATTAGSSLNLLAGVDLSGANAITNAVIINRNFTIGGSQSIEFSGPVTLATTAPQSSINVTNPAGAVISGPISGVGFGFNKTGQGLLTLSGVSTYDGPTSLSVGNLALGPGAALPGTSQISVGQTTVFDVSAAGGLTIGAAQTLRGAGSVKGNVTVNGALIPAGVIFTLTFSNNLTLASGSTTTLTISRDALPGPEQVICLGVLAYGGSLVVDNGGSDLQAGDTFDLFGFTGSPGSFLSLTLPLLDLGLAWNTGSLSVDGTISVVSTASPQPLLSNPRLPTLSSFAMTATGGTPNGQFRVLSQTNIAAPIANWEILSTNTYDGSGNLTLTNPVNPAELQRYFRVVQP